MTKWLIALCLMLAIAVWAYAQATPKVYWDHDGLNVTRFECVVDGGTPTDLELPTPTNTTYSVDITACTGVMVDGTHSLVVQACNTAGCTAAVAITVVKL